MMIGAAQSIAKIILEGFDKHYLAFRTNSQLAKSKFENSEYSEIRELLSERISFYDLRVKETSNVLDVKYGNEIKENLFWPEVKKAYIMFLTEHKHSKVTAPRLACRGINHSLPRQLRHPSRPCGLRLRLPGGPGGSSSP